MCSDKLLRPPGRGAGAKAHCDRSFPSLPALLLATALAPPGALAGPDGPAAARHTLTAIPARHVVIDDEFWAPRLKLWREVTIPDCFAKFERDGALTNFDKVRDGTGGEHRGPPWYDGLIYEMIRASADFLAIRRDPALEARLDGYIERIAAAAARDPDGYLNTHTRLEEPMHRWGLNGGDDKEQHDLYNAGALVEAADNDGHAQDLVLPPTQQLTPEPRPDLLGGVTVLRGTASVVEPGQPPADDPAVRDIAVTAIPYFANTNRQPGGMLVWIAETPEKARPRSLASRATPSASHGNPSDTVKALNGQVEDPSASDDTTIHRFTWWDHRGTRESVQYNFDREETISAVEVYWWDERRINAHCRVPESWRLLYRTPDDRWEPVPGASPYGTEMDRHNRVTFDPVKTRALRLEAQLQPDWSGGILEWRVE